MAKSSFYTDGGTTASNVDSITSLTNEATASKNAAKVSEDAAAASATASASSATASASSASSITGFVTSAQAAQTAAETAQSAASTSASQAASSAVASASSATASETSKVASETAKTAAETAKTASETAKTASETAKTAAETALDNFTDQYLGAHSSNRTTDLDGNSLVVGTLMYNTTDNNMKVYDGSAWDNTFATLSGTLQISNNLSDLNNASTARSNLGVAIGGQVQAHSSVLDATTASYTTALNTKLNAIEASATADQTDAEIRAAVEAASDSNVFTDADHSKLNAIEASADVTDTANVTAAGALMDSEVTNLSEVKAFDASEYATAAQGTLATNALPKSGGAMTGAITTNSTFDGRDVATDGTKLDGIESNATADQTDAEIRAAVEAASDSNVFTDADHSKLNAIEASATADQTASEILTAIKTVDGASSGLDADLLDGQHGSYYAPLASPTFTGNPVAPTQSASNNSTRIATTAYTDAAIAALADSAPSTLNTLNELAAALGDDANFSTTVTNNIAAKLSLAGGTMTGTLVAPTINVSGNIDVDGISNLDVVDIDGAVDMATTLTVAGNVDFNGDLDVDGTTNLDVVDVDGLLTASAAIEINGAAGAGISEGMLIDWSTNLARFLTYDSSSGSEIAFFTQPSGGSTAERVRIKDDGGFVVTPVAGGHAVFNEGSIDADFRVESNGNANMLFVDGGNDRVGINNGSPARQLHITDTIANSGASLGLTSSDSSTTGSMGIIHFGNSTDSSLASIGAIADGATDSGALLFKTEATGGAIEERMRIDSSGNVGIGEVTQTDLNTAYDHLQIGKPVNIMGSDTNGGLWLNSGAFFNSAGNWEYLLSSETVSSLTMTDSIPFRFRYAAAGTAGNTFSWSEAMRIDSSGNVLVGKTAVDFAVAGTEIMDHGEVQVTRAGGVPMYLRRNTSDGVLIGFYKDATAIGNIGTVGTDMYIGTTDTGLRFLDSSNTIIPARGDTGATRDDAISFGTASARYDNIYATNATIQTSDQTEKQDIAALTSTEMLVGKRISALFKTFRWKDKVVEKGDNARTHTGIIAQDVQAAFTAEGLDAGDYSLFISSTWLVDSEGNEVEEGTEDAVSKTRMGIRYPELLSFVAAYNEQRFANIETRLTTLEG